MVAEYLTCLSNYTATTDPTVNDDVTDGYARGSLWINTLAGMIFMLDDPTAGAAVWRCFYAITGTGTGGLTDYDLTVGGAEYGMIRFGNAAMGRTSFNVGNIDLDGAVLFRNISGPVTSEIEYLFAESAGGTCRFALPRSGVGNAAYLPRSVLIAGPAPADTDFVKVGYWQAQGIFDNLLCDTSGFGADLGVQHDLEVEGDIFTDSIKESTTGAGITLDDAVLAPNIKSGVDQATAGAAVGEIWADTNDANSLKLGV